MLWRKRTPFELAVLLVAMVATLAILAGLGITATRYGSGPAELVTEVDSRDRPGHYRVTVLNRDGHSAEAVVVVVRLGSEERELTLERVAKGDEKSAVVVFRPEPQGRPEARVGGYTEP